jgi:hypothetical protein
MRSPARPTDPPAGAPSRLRSANAPIGMLLLVFLGFGAASGLALWQQLTFANGPAIALVSVHAYVGLVGLPVLLAKIVVGLAAVVTSSRPRGVTGLVDRLMTALLVAVVVALYGSGVAMYSNAFQGGLLKTVHLWAAVVGVPIVSYHLWRFLRRARAMVSRAVSLGSGPVGTRSRRHVLVAGALALLGWGAVRAGAGVLTDVGAQEPNDFPVTLTSGGSDQPDPQRWRMHIAGEVRRPLTVSLEDLRGGPVERHRYSLDCILGWSVTRTWGGVPLQYLLREAAASKDLVSVVVRSSTGYQVALLREQIEDPRTMVTWEVDGVDLTPEHGFPARITAPGVIGELCVKWVDSITVVAA